MANAKVELKIGPISFSGEAEEKWLSAQLDKLFQQAPGLMSHAPSEDGDKGIDGATGQTKLSKGDPGTLAKFLQSKGATANQVKRFLASAAWLTLRGNKTPSTADVTKALRDNHQSKLSNPADCLNKNVGKGHCEKAGDKFFVTPDGLTSLG